ncbi:hypothetical protein H2248_005623 [Termitomyces sp. 'cryptogamus']|nr:hypothetical protein H2248_005623 [Termitomyces sp. 'cryptogamus']
MLSAVLVLSISARHSPHRRMESTLLYKEQLSDPYLRTKIIVFDTFAFLGVLVNTAVLAPPLLSSHIQRSKIWFSLIFSWILYSASYTLLLGRQTRSQPPFGLCIFQGALTTSTPLVCIVASTCFAADFALQIRAASHGRESNRMVTNFLAWLPWVVFLIVFLESFLVIQDSSMVVRNPSHLFCTINNRKLYLTTGIMILLSAVILFPLEAYMAIMFHRHSVLSLRQKFIVSKVVCFSTFTRLVLFSIISAAVIGYLSLLTFISQMLIAPQIPLVCNCPSEQYSNDVQCNPFIFNCCEWLNIWDKEGYLECMDFLEKIQPRQCSTIQ